ncbi:MAG: hypothetical protein M1286_01150 [Candidatus Marsarchaeota archaeon]|nr:hypothetical protein [Candidatus Marsarchaeota archaeon]
MKLTKILVLFLLLGSVNAAGLFTGFCNSLFPATLSGSNTASLNYVPMMTIALEVVFTVLVVLGVVFAFGYAFGIDSLKKFSKREVVESLFNIFVIAAIAGGLAFSGSAISFLSNIGFSNLQSFTPGQPGYYPVSSLSQSQISSTGCASSQYVYEKSCGNVSSITAPQVCAQRARGVCLSYRAGNQCTSSPTTGQICPVLLPVNNTQSVYHAICYNYVDNGVTVLWNNALSLFVASAFINTVQSVQIQLSPNNLGFDFSPFQGLEPFASL